MPASTPARLHFHYQLWGFEQSSGCSALQQVMQLDAGRPGPAGDLECFLCCFSAFQPQHSQRKPLQPPLLLTALQRPSLPQHSLPGAERRAAWPHCWPSIQREREAEWGEGKKTETKLVSQLVAELPCSDCRRLPNSLSRYRLCCRALQLAFGSPSSANPCCSRGWAAFLGWVPSHPALSGAPSFLPARVSQRFIPPSLPRVNNPSDGHRPCVLSQQGSS